MDVSSVGGYEPTSSGISDRQVFGAQVVSATLDTMNQHGGSSSHNDSSYDFQTSVLGAAYTGRGTMLDTYI